MRISGGGSGFRVVLVTCAAVFGGGCAGTPRATLSGPAPRDSVMIGYGAAGRSVAMGAVSSLTREQLDAHYPSMGEVLKGRIPGLDVVRTSGGSFRLRIRGVSSFLGTDEPLVVVDGVALQASRDLWSINPRDVERVDVLRDGSAAIYGVRGGSGVIVITTRRPG